MSEQQRTFSWPLVCHYPAINANISKTLLVDTISIASRDSKVTEINHIIIQIFGISKGIKILQESHILYLKSALDI